jgi:hypothetical protein
LVKALHAINARMWGVFFSEPGLLDERRRRRHDRLKIADRLKFPSHLQGSGCNITPVPA